MHPHREATQPQGRFAMIRMFSGRSVGRSRFLNAVDIAQALSQGVRMPWRL